MFAHKILLVIFIVFCLLAAHTLQESPRELNYPIRLGYITKVTSWWGAGVLKDLGVPGSTTSTTIDYNYIVLGYWTCNGAPDNVAQLWATLQNWGLKDLGWGSTTA